MKNALARSSRERKVRTEAGGDLFFCGEFIVRCLAAAATD